MRPKWATDNVSGSQLYENIHDDTILQKNVKWMEKGELGIEKIVKDRNGQILVPGLVARKRWTEYFEF